MYRFIFTLFIVFLLVFAPAGLLCAQNYGYTSNGQVGRSKPELGAQIRKRQALSAKGKKAANKKKTGFFMPGGQIKRAAPINGRLRYLQRRSSIKNSGQVIQGYRAPVSAKPQPVIKPQDETVDKPGIAPPDDYFDDGSKNKKKQPDKELARTGLDENGKPQFQNQYQDYLTDLEEIRKDGTGKEQWGVDKDLMEMNSDERIAIDQEFNARQDPEAEFNQTLDTILDSM